MLIHLSLSLSISLNRISLCRSYLLSASLTPFLFLFLSSVHPSIHPSTAEHRIQTKFRQINKADGWDDLHVGLALSQSLTAQTTQIDWNHLVVMGIQNAIAKEYAEINAKWSNRKVNNTLLKHWVVIILAAENMGWI